MTKKSITFATDDITRGEIQSSSLSSGTKKSAKLASNEAFFVSQSFQGVENGVTFSEYRQQLMAKRKLPYKEPKIIRCASGDWYVEYYFLDPQIPGKWVEKKVRSGINYIKDPGEKEREANQLRRDVLQWLKDGNSPFKEQQSVERQLLAKEAEIQRLSQNKGIWSLEAAIIKYKAFIEEENHTESTLRTYRKYIGAFYAWLDENNLLDQKACTFTEMDARVYLDDLFIANDWSARTFNNYRDFIVTFIVACNKLEKIARKDRKLVYDFEAGQLESKITRAIKNKAYSPVLAEVVKKELDKNPDYANLRDYIHWIFYSLMRPDEIRHLKVKDIDQQAREIKIIGKTGGRIIPIPDQLLDLINRRGVLKANHNCFVFGYAGRVDQRRMSVAYFLTLYKELRTKHKISDEYGPYSWKHTAVIRLIKAGFKDEEIMVLSGHKTIEAFRAYKRDLIVDNSHVMKGGLIDF